jgi:hypothetical protein
MHYFIPVGAVYNRAYRALLPNRFQAIFPLLSEEGWLRDQTNAAKLPQPRRRVVHASAG